MKLFVDKEAEITVNIFVYEKSGKIIAVWTGNNLSGQPEIYDPKDVKKFQAFFRLPSYQDTVEINDTSIQLDNLGKMKIVPNQLSFSRFARLLKRWDLVDDKGENVPAIAESVAALDPVIGDKIAADLDAQIKSIST